MTVTETDPMTDPQVVSILDNLRNISNEVKQIDSELGTDSGGPVAQRNKIAAQYVAQYNTEGSDVANFVSQVMAKLNDPKLSDSLEKLTAVVTELENQISKISGGKVKDFLQKQVDAQPKTETAELSDERKKELADRRSNIANIFKLQAEMLKYYGVVTLPSDIEAPPIRRGSTGPRVSLTKSYQYFVDGKLKQFTDQDTGEKSDVNLSYLANSVCKELNWKTADLRNFIMEQYNITPTDDGKSVDLPNEWEVKLPAPVDKTLKGVAVTVTSANANVDESDDSEDESNGESENAFSGV